MKKYILMICSLIVLINCKSDDESGQGDQNNSELNEQIYLHETHPVDFIRIYYVAGTLYIQGGNNEETRGFDIGFPEAEFADINGHYNLNTDDQTYNPETDFRSGLVYYADDSQYAQEGEASIELDAENEKITIELELDVQGNIYKAHYEGNYN